MIKKCFLVGICWQIIISSRYKLDKKYRKIKEKLQGSTDYKSQKLLQQAKVSIVYNINPISLGLLFFLSIY